MKKELRTSAGKRSQGRARDGMERTEEAEGVDSGALEGAAGVGAWGTFAQMRVGCSQLLAGPFGKVRVDS